MRSAEAKPVHRYIRELRDRHRGERAVILGKGPSLDVWWSRGGCGDERDSWLLFAINETVLIPGLSPDYWFWKTPDDPRQVEKFGPPPAKVQVFPEQMFWKDAAYAERRAAAHPSLIYMCGCDAPDDPWAVPGEGTSGTAAFFCAGLWGCKSVLGVGFDARESPRMRTYARCVIPWSTEPENTDPIAAPHVPSYRKNNRAIDVAIRRFGLHVTWYHQQVTAAEIAEAGSCFR
jgi:hypothetical protein